MNKIAIHIDSLGRGGAERVTVNLAKYLVAHGYACAIVTERVAKYEYEVPDGVERVNLGVDCNKFLHYVSNVRRLRHIYRGIGFDTLLIMDLPACLLSIPAVQGLNAKTVVSERNDPTHFPGKKIVAIISRWLMTKADGFVFQTADAMEFYKELIGERGAVIPNPLYLTDLPAVSDGPRRKEIVAVGRLTPQKNQDMLIEAFSRIKDEFPDWRLLIFGEGELRSELEAKVSSRGLKGSVILPGNKTNLLERVKDSAVFAMPSNFEGMPNALLEAMALGLACVSTDCPIGGPRAIIKPGTNGLLVDVGDIDGLTGALRTLMSNEKMRGDFGMAAAEVRETFDSDKVCLRWQEYLQSL